jgi:phospholipase C
MIHDQEVPMGDPIEHVIVLMMENHSFDQMLGGLA